MEAVYCEIIMIAHSWLLFHIKILNVSRFAGKQYKLKLDCTNNEIYFVAHKGQLNRKQISTQENVNTNNIIYGFLLSDGTFKFDIASRF